MNEPIITRRDITVDAFEWRKTQAGKDYIQVLFNGSEKANCFDHDAIAQITEKCPARWSCDIKEMEWNGRPAYTIVSVLGAAKSPPVVNYPSLPATAGLNSRDKSIKSQVALKAVVELVCAGKIDLAQVKEFTKAFTEILTELEK